MRKKSHKKLNPQNKYYDEFYLGKGRHTQKKCFIFLLVGPLRGGGGKTPLTTKQNPILTKLTEKKYAPLRPGGEGVPNP